MRVLVSIAVVLASSAAFAQSAGGSAAKPTTGGKAESLSPSRPPQAFQSIGSFPTNTVTSRPYVGPQGGEDGLKKTVGALQTTLTELQQLQLQTKQIHWNVSGPEFYQIHLMMQLHYENVSKQADMVAQRLLAIGVSADGRANTVVKTSGLPEIPGGFIDGAQAMGWLTDAYALVGNEIRRGINDTQDTDPTTGNILQGVEQVIDENQWMARAFLQPTPTNPNDGSQFSGGKAIDLPKSPNSTEAK